MQLPRVRISLKRLMIAIAALAIVLGCSIEGIRLKRRRDAFLRKAAEHGVFEYMSREDQKSALRTAEIEDEYRSSLEKLRQENPTPAPAPTRAEIVETDRSIARFGVVGSMVPGPIRRGMLAAGRHARGGHSTIINLRAGQSSGV